MPQQAKPYTNPMDDGRRKIHPEDHPEIIRAYHRLQSYQKTANLYGVSKRLIIFIVNPDIAQRRKDENRKNQHHKRYYDTNKRREYMRKYRAKKRLHNLMPTYTKICKNPKCQIKFTTLYKNKVFHTNKCTEQYHNQSKHLKS